MQNASLNNRMSRPTKNAREKKQQRAVLLQAEAHPAIQALHLLAVAAHQDAEVLRAADKADRSITGFMEGTTVSFLFS